VESTIPHDAGAAIQVLPPGWVQLYARDGSVVLVQEADVPARLAEGYTLKGGDPHQLGADLLPLFDTLRARFQDFLDSLMAEGVIDQGADGALTTFKVAWRQIADGALTTFKVAWRQIAEGLDAVETAAFQRFPVKQGTPAVTAGIQHDPGQVVLRRTNEVGVFVAKQLRRINGRWRIIWHSCFGTVGQVPNGVFKAVDCRQSSKKGGSGVAGQGLSPVA
jgi:hypothetical protein